MGRTLSDILGAVVIAIGPTRTVILGLCSDLNDLMRTTIGPIPDSNSGTPFGSK